MPDWRRLSWTDRLAWFIGTGFGCGFFPFAPGSVGSAAAIAIYAVVMFLLPAESWASILARYVVLMAMAAVGFMIGVWATGRMSTDDNPDPGSAVWDEFVGMWLALLPGAAFDWRVSPEWTIGWLAGAFLAFRAFDTLKPWPCRWLERLHGGWGIMLDDVAAGIWCILATQVVGALFALGWFMTTIW